MQRTYSVTGMTCQGCKASVHKKLSQVDGVSEVAIDLEKGEEYQVTSTLLGATQPDISPSGKKLAFSEFTADGWDLRKFSCVRVGRKLRWYTTNKVEKIRFPIIA